MFGVPIERQPETLAEFYEYFEGMVEEELAVTSALRTSSTPRCGPSFRSWRGRSSRR